MNPLVIDSSVAVKWLVAEPDSDDADAVRHAIVTGAVAPIAPDWIDAEIGNILWQKTRRQGLPAAEAEVRLAKWLAFRIDRTPAADLLPDALSLALRFGTSVYDSLYLALSERESCPFVTADARLVHAVAAPLAGPVTLKDWAAAHPPPSPPSP